MYPWIRSAYHHLKAKSCPPFEHPMQEHSLRLRVWPSDLDLFMELNNGRYLTLMDMGRTGVGVRVGLFGVLRKQSWGLMVGAVNGRFRHRLRLLQAFTIYTQIIAFDERWIYFRQWFEGEQGRVHASFLVRTAATSAQGLVPTRDLLDAMGYEASDMEQYFKHKDWLAAWVASDELHREIME